MRTGPPPHNPPTSRRVTEHGGTARDRADGTRPRQTNPNRAVQAIGRPSQNRTADEIDLAPKSPPVRTGKLGQVHSAEW
ncbi:hypothetical protein GCM10023321_35180 [Pseudonocardia eucalypti]|uniref:Uncharacterized protein n=1 Tax=Pseudonocardia eucalypti TaxID=648755 RepID=A0ABP9Q5P1_9PSEU